VEWLRQCQDFSINSRQSPVASRQQFPIRVDADQNKIQMNQLNPLDLNRKDPDQHYLHLESCNWLLLEFHEG
jgi:hypothetical protein